MPPSSPRGPRGPRGPSSPVLSLNEHITELISLAGPLILSQVLTISMTLVDFAMVGRLGNTELAAASLATTWFNLLNHPVTGGLTALDTFFSQSFGAKDHVAVNRWLRTGAVATVAVTIPQALLVATCSPALQLFGQDAHLSDLASSFCNRLIPGLIPFYLFQLLTKYLQCNGILNPSIYIAAVANVLNILTNYLFIYSFGIGLNGAAISTTLMRWLQFFGLLLYIVMYLKPRTPSIEASWPTTFNSWYSIALSSSSSSPSSSSDPPSPPTFAPFFALALPGMLMLATEAWAFEISTILAGLLHDLVSLDAHAALLTTCAFAFLSVPFAIGIAGCIRTGTFLGSGDWRNAKGGARAILVLTTCTQVVVAALFLVGRRPVSYLFTDDDAVAEAVERLCTLAALFQVSDGLQSAVGGVLRGVGKHRVVLAMNVVGFWVLGLPIMGALTFGGKGLGVAGIWWGFVVGLSSTAGAGVYYVTKVLDFEKEVQVAKNRAEGGGGGGGEGEGEGKDDDEEEKKMNRNPLIVALSWVDGFGVIGDDWDDDDDGVFDANGNNKQPPAADDNAWKHNIYIEQGVRMC